MSLRPFAVAAALLLTAGGGVAAAQTLIARRAPIGSTIELLVNSTKAGPAQADAAGDAKIPFTLPAGKTEIDARVYVDTCGETRRVLVADRDSVAVPPETDCIRQEVTGVFLVRKVSSLVVNVGNPGRHRAAAPGHLRICGARPPPRRRREASWSSEAGPGRSTRRAAVRLRRRADLLGRR